MSGTSGGDSSEGARDDQGVVGGPPWAPPVSWGVPIAADEPTADQPALADPLAQPPPAGSPPPPGYGAPPGYGPPPVHSPPPGYCAPGYPPPGYGSPGYPPPGYGAPGYPPPGYGAPGYPPMPSYGLPPVRPTNGNAVWALVLGLLALVTTVAGCPPLGLAGIVAVVLGIRARRQVVANNEVGDGMALAGIITGAVSSALAIFVVVLLAALMAVLSQNAEATNPQGPTRAGSTVLLAATLQAGLGAGHVEGIQTVVMDRLSRMHQLGRRTLPPDVTAAGDRLAAATDSRRFR